MLIIQKIEDIVRNYEDFRKIVGEFLIKEKRNLNNYSMQKIADMTYTSKSTLVRIAKVLDFLVGMILLNNIKKKLFI